MQQHEQIEFLKAVGAFVVEQVRAVTLPLLEKISTLESRIAALDDGWAKDMEAVKDTFNSYVMLEDFTKAKDGKDGVDGKDGKDAVVDHILLSENVLSTIFTALIPEEHRRKGVDIVYQIAEALAYKASCLVEKGKDGKDGVDGKDGTNGTDGKDANEDFILSKLMGQLHETLEHWPKPKDGIDGKDGKDGRDGTDGKSVSLDELRVSIIDMVRDAVDDLPAPRHVVSGHIDRAGCLHHVFNNGETLALGVVVGRDGKDGTNGTDGIDGKKGEAGKDGLGFKDMSVTFDGERDFIFKFTLDDRVEELALTVPFQIYRGVWREGSYRRGDTVSRSGSQWVAIRDTDAQPGTAESGWQLSVKKGNDGKDGKAGDKGDKGDPGRDGKDLTQIGPDGKKWG